MEKLPEDFRLRLHAMNTHWQCTLADAIKLLPELKKEISSPYYLDTIREIEHYVELPPTLEVIVFYLASILKHPTNKDILDTIPILQPDQVNAIINKYQQHVMTDGFTKKGNDISTLLPNTLMHELLPQVTIHTLEAWLGLIANFPPELYSELIGSVNFTYLKTPYGNLSNWLSIKVLHSDQAVAILNAIIKHSNQFGVLGIILPFIMISNMPIKAILNNLPID